MVTGSSNRYKFFSMISSEAEVFSSETDELVTVEALDSKASVHLLDNTMPHYYMCKFLHLCFYFTCLLR